MAVDELLGIVQYADFLILEKAAKPESSRDGEEASESSRSDTLPTTGAKAGR